jgi:hypothetical protein
MALGNRGTFPQSLGSRHSQNAWLIPASVRLGDVDGDGRCDVVKDAGSGNWLMASGGIADWTQFGNFMQPLNEVRFGRFDPANPDHDPGIRPPTHAFWRRDDGQWFVTPLSQPQQRTMVESSGFPLDNLRFGDFTGDGVTDVLANEGGHWAISDATRGGWTLLNPTLNDPLSNSFSIANDKITHIYIANMDSDDNVDDVLRLDVPIVGIQGGSTTLTGSWQRSVNGTTPWNLWKSYAFTIDGDHPEDYADFGFAFVGQFRGGFGATALTIDPNRIGHFFSPGQRSPTEWVSLFPY